MGLVPGRSLHGPRRSLRVPRLLPRTAPGNSRGIRRSTLEAGGRLDDPLRRGGRDGSPRRSPRGLGVAAAEGSRPSSRVRDGVRLWTPDLPGVVHEDHVRRELRSRGPQDASARVALDERPDGGNDPRHADLDEPGPGGDGADRYALLGCDVAGDSGGFFRSLPGECLAGRPWPQAWDGHSQSAWPGRSQAGPGARDATPRDRRQGRGGFQPPPARTARASGRDRPRRFRNAGRPGGRYPGRGGIRRVDLDRLSSGLHDFRRSASPSPGLVPVDPAARVAALPDRLRRGRQPSRRPRGHPRSSGTEEHFPGPRRKQSAADRGTGRALRRPSARPAN